MTAIVDACDAIRERCNHTTTTFLLHHSSQTAMTNKDMTAAAMRGATDLVDGLRWVMILQYLDDKKAKDYKIAENDRQRYRQYSIPLFSALALPIVTYDWLPCRCRNDGYFYGC